MHSNSADNRQDDQAADQRPAVEKERMQDMPPVFYTEKKRRWSIFKYASLALSVVLLALGGLLMTAVLVQVSLPHLRLPIAHSLVGVAEAQPRNERARIHRAESAVRKAREELERYLSTHRIPARAPRLTVGRGAATTAAAATTPPVLAPSVDADTDVHQPYHSAVIGFYVDWDEASVDSLRSNIERLTELMPEWLHLSGRAGAVVQDDPVAQQATLAYVRQHRPGLWVTPLINDYSNRLNNWDGASLAAVLRSGQA